MDAGGKVVRLNHAKLRQLSKKFEDCDEEDDEDKTRGDGRDRDKVRKGGRQSKKPERPIYQPGKTKLSRRDGSDTQTATENMRAASPETQKTSAGEDEKANETKKRVKRPDVQVYVPKPKLQAQEGEKRDAKSSKSTNENWNDITITSVSTGSESPSRKVTLTPEAAGAKRPKGRGRGGVREPARRGGRRQRERKISSCSVEFMNDEMEWDYQVEIEAQQRGQRETDSDDEYFPSLQDLPPVQPLLGVDPQKTLEDLEISFSADELSDQDASRDTHRRIRNKRQVRTKHRGDVRGEASRNESRDTKEKPAAFTGMKSDAPEFRKVGSHGQDKPRPQRERPMLRTSQEGGEEEVTRRKAEKKPNDQLVIEVRADGGQPGSHPRDSKGRVVRKHNEEDKTEDHLKKDRNLKGRSGMGDNKGSQQSKRKEVKSNVHSKSSSAGEKVEESPDRPSSRASQRSSGGQEKNKAKTEMDKKGKRSAQPAAGRKSPMHWGDLVEMEGQEVDFESEILDFGSESSQNSSAKTPDGERPRPQLSQSSNNGSSSKTNGRRSAKQKDVAPKAPNAKPQSSHKSKSPSPPKDRRPEVTSPKQIDEYDMGSLDDQFGGLVITNSSYSRQSVASRRKTADGPKYDRRQKETPSDRREGEERRKNKDMHDSRQRRNSGQNGTSQRQRHESGNSSHGNDAEYAQSQRRFSKQRRGAERKGNADGLRHDDVSDERHSDWPARGGRSTRGHRGGRQDNFNRQRSMSHSSTDSQPPASARGGGILRLPAEATNDPSFSRNAESPEMPPPPPPDNSSYPPLGPPSFSRGRGQATRARGRGRGRGSHRTLYDPNNPQKTQVPQQSTSPRQLHFHDPHENDYNSNGAHLHSNEDAYQSNEYSQNYMASPYQGMYGGMPYSGQNSGYYPPREDMRSGDADFYGEDEYNTQHVPMASDAPPSAHLFAAAAQMEARLLSHIQRRMRTMDDYTLLIRLKRDYQFKCVDILVTDIETSHNCNLDQSLWKTAYYQIIEVIRKMISMQDDQWEPRMLDQHLSAILDDGTEFYVNLLKTLQGKYKFDLNLYYDMLEPYPCGLGRSAKLALYSAHMCLLCLGDLARYREQQRHGSNFSQAREWYEKAQMVMPKNGRPYNQLAILAMYTKKLTDAVYYFVRSLAASNPFVNGREILMTIFEDVRRRAEATEKTRLQERAEKQKKPRAERSGQGQRVEIWVHADGSSSEDMIREDEDNELSCLTPHELNRRFHTSFLHVHGKLFCKVGAETFQEVSAMLLHEFTALLAVPGSRISRVRLLQLVTINMFAVHNLASKDRELLDENCRPLLQEHAVQLGLEMYAVLAQRCTQLLEEHLDSGSPQIFSPALEELVPSVLVWTDWMTVHQDLWNPPPVSRDPVLGPVIDVWQITADLCNTASRLDTSHIKFYKQKREGCVAVILEEDKQMEGFYPLALFSEDETYVHSLVDLKVARDCLRAQKLRFFGEYLLGLEDPLLKWNAKLHCLENVHKLSPDGAEDRQYDRHLSHESDDVIIESVEEEQEELNTSGGTEEIAQLRARKHELQKQMAQQAMAEEKRDRAVEASEQRLVEITVRPRYLVPDTNCFIDHLDSLRRLLECQKYMLIVPLIVITELDGLSKGSREGQYDCPEHAGKVRLRAERTVQYLEAEFSARNSHLRALTGMGNVLETITFRSEETGGRVGYPLLIGTNDDVILTCCKHYCQDRARDFMPARSIRSEPIRLTREVVLLTDDRNLRLKAHTQNVPVKSVPAFLRWCKVP